MDDVNGCRTGVGLGHDQATGPDWQAARLLAWGQYRCDVSFRPEAARQASENRSGTVDYRLARRHLIAEHKRGRLSRNDVCDAHPELVRAAIHVGTPREEICPICEEVPLVEVSYVFGGRLPSFGRCITKASELMQFRKQQGPYTCYVVEVCTNCRWNHLSRLFQLGRITRPNG